MPVNNLLQMDLPVSHSHMSNVFDFFKTGSKFILKPAPPDKIRREQMDGQYQELAVYQVKEFGNIYCNYHVGGL